MQIACWRDPQMMTTACLIVTCVTNDLDLGTPLMSS